MARFQLDPIRMDRLLSKRWVMMGYLVLMTLLGTYLIGYRFGTIDHAIYVPFFKHLLRPELYAGDALVALSANKVTFVWHLLAPLAHLIGVEHAFFAGYLICTFVMYAALMRLAWILLGRIGLGYLTVLAFLLPKIALGGFLTWDPMLLPRIVALPWLVVALGSYLKGERLRALFLAALMTNIHALTSLPIVLALLASSVWDASGNRLKTFFWSLGLVLAGMVPTVLWLLRVSDGQGWQINRGWFDFLQLVSSTEHVFYDLSQPLILQSTIIVAVAALVMMAALRYLSRYGWLDGAKQRTLMVWLVVWTALLVMALLIHTLWPIPLLVQISLVRTSRFLVLMAWILAVAWGLAIALHNASPRWWKVAFAGILASTLGVMIMMPYLFFSRFFVRSYRIALVAVLAGFLAVLTQVRLYRLLSWEPGIHIMVIPSAEVEVQQWMKENTAVTDRFIVLPYLDGITLVDWRVVSERSMVATQKEVSEVMFNPGMEIGYSATMDKLANGHYREYLLLRRAGRMAEAYELMRSVYHSYTANEYVALGKYFDSSYLVVERDKALSLPCVYANQHYAVYQLNQE